MIWLFSSWLFGCLVVRVVRTQAHEDTPEHCCPTKATLSILFDACLGRDGAEAALAAAGGESGNLAHLHSPGAEAAKMLYREAVEAGLMQV